MNKIKYQLIYKNYHYLLKEVKSKKIIHDTITFYSMYCFLLQYKFAFSEISLPRLTLYTFFRDYASFDMEERI